MWSLPQGSITFSADRLGKCSGVVGFFTVIRKILVMLEHRRNYKTVLYARIV